MGPEERQTTLFGFFKSRMTSRSTKMVQSKVSEYFDAKDMSGYEKRITKPKKQVVYRQSSLDEFIWDESILSFKKF